MNKKYNFDLLCNEGDEAYLRSQYPKIADRIIWPKLRDAFIEHEKKANSMKRASRSSNFTGIFLIVLSLLLTLVGTSELTRTYLQANPSVSVSLAIIATVLLVIGLVLGKGVVLSKNRDQWLAERQRAERLRQFHFQLIIAHADLVCTCEEQAGKSWDEVRERELERVRRVLSGNTYTQQVKNDHGLNETFLVDIRRIYNVKDVQSLDFEKLRQFTNYYCEFRIDWQEDYVNLQFEESAAAIPVSGSLAEREKLSSIVEHIATLGIVLFQIGAVLSQLFGNQLSPTTDAFVLGSSILAIIIVGLHAFRDGTSVTEDLLRYRHYSSNLQYAHSAFEEAADRDNDTTGILAAAKRIEEASYFEMREFLIAHSKSNLSL